LRIRESRRQCRDGVVPSALLPTALLFFLLALSPFQGLFAAATGEGVGRVVFAIGPVHVETEGSERSITRGARVYEGDRITTGSGGNAQIRFEDGGFLGLRPESAVRIRAYRPGEEGTDEVRIRLEVDHGTVRSVTGAGGERDRDGFRLNTPVAAVGVRGTDFTVRADRQLTRVQVHAGGVGVSPFTANCRRDGLGACSGEASRTLFARDADQRVLEVVRGATRARIIEPESASGGEGERPQGKGDGAAAQADSTEGDESAADADSSTDTPETATSSASNDGKQETSSQAGVDEVDSEAGSTISDVDENRRASRTIDGAERRARFEAVRDDITWGRWSALANPGGSVTEQRREDQAVMAVNQVFGLLTPRWRRFPDIGLPDSGVVEFNVGSTEAVLLEGSETRPASVTNPELAVDFARRLFRTRLEVESGQLDGAVSVRAEGTVDSSGRMESRAADSNATVNGIVGPGGRQAGLLFERTLDGGTTAAGAIDWFR